MNEEQLEDCLREYLKSHSQEDLYNLHKKAQTEMAALKEQKELHDGNMEEMRLEREKLKEQTENTEAEIAAEKEKLEALNESMKELKSNQAAKAEKKRQRADEDKLARMDASKIKELRGKLTTLRETVCNLEEEVEELEKKKPELQSQIVQIRSSIKEKRENEKMLTSKRDKSKEELEYRMEQLESLMKTVEVLRADITRAGERLNSNTPVKTGGKTLFDEVLAEKKVLEQELLKYSETNANLRQAIRCMQDEIDELQLHDSDGKCKIEIDEVLKNMKAYIDLLHKLCHGLRKMQTNLKSSISQIENNLVEMQEDVNRDNFGLIKDYDLKRINGVLNQTEELRDKLESRFFEIEQLAAESHLLRETHK
ncbi:hypothetical protein M3Y98_00639300 [Aphelenchoides besseyi]|nr:hypothetical protein M3Y98_00639300 [Aphelenchoides besseyi]KAI6208552.1 hypothetical protein M3Y96_00127300 [Aphelenchoides besseyi]